MKSMERVLGVTVFLILEASLLVQLYRASNNRKNRLRLQTHGFLRTSTNTLFSSFSTNVWRDESDSDWDTITQWLSYLPFYVLYLIYSTSLNFVLHKRSLLASTFRTAASILLAFHFVGLLLVLDVLVLTILFVAMGVVFRGNRLVIWIITPPLLLGFDYAMSTWFYRKLFAHWVSNSDALQAMVLSAHFLLLLRSMSIALCLADGSPGLLNQSCNEPLTQQDNASARITPIHLWKTLWIALEYNFYPYAFFWGPLVSFQDWLDFKNGEIDSKCVKFAKLSGRIRPLTMWSLVSRAVRLVFWYHFWYLVLCFIYPGALLAWAHFQSAISREPGINPWESGGFSAHPATVFTAAHMSGVHFYMIHLMFYGIPGVLADLEQFLSPNQRLIVSTEGDNTAHPCCAEEKIPNPKKESSANSNPPSSTQLCLLPAPPSCVGHVALYSEMWRTFDRGLYSFVLRHIYYPLRPLIQSTEGLLGVVSSASVLVVPFLFVLVFHSISYANVIWTIMNFTQLLAERILKWAFRHTSFGVLLRQKLPHSVLEHGINLLKALSWVYSLTAFVFFRFGYDVGVQFLQFAVLTPNILWSILLFFTAQSLRAELVERCSYAGFPVGFTWNNP